MRMFNRSPVGVALAMTVLTVLSAGLTISPSVSASNMPVVNSTPLAKQVFKKPIVKHFAWQSYPVISLGSDEVFTRWIVVIYNPNKRAYGEYPTFRIVAKDAAGRLLASEEETLTGLIPGGKVAVSSQISTRVIPATVEAQIVDGDFVKTKAKPSSFRQFITSNIGIIPISGDEFDLSGEVTNPYPTAQNVAITIAVKNIDGQVIGGNTTYLDKIQPNQVTPFYAESTWTWANGTPVTYEAFVAPRTFLDPWTTNALKK